QGFSAPCERPLSAPGHRSIEFHAWNPKDLRSRRTRGAPMRVPRPSRLLLTAAVALAGVGASVAAAGPACAAPGLTIVTATSVETGSEGFKSANAVCPPNTVIFGG